MAGPGRAAPHAGTPPTSGSAERRHGYPAGAGLDPWWLAGELARRLDHSLSLPEALARASQWLSEALGLPAAIVLARDEAVEEVFASPYGEVVAAGAAASGLGTAEEGATQGPALREGRTVHVPVVAPGLSPFGGPTPSQVRSMAVAPLTGAEGALGAVVVHSPVPAGVGASLVAALEAVAGPLALLVANARLRRELSEMQSAQEAARLREELLAALSHDMQTPLAVLLGSIKALQAVDDLAPKHRAGLYEGMARRGGQLKRLVEQFLDYSRIEAGRPIEVRPSETDVTAAIARLETDVGWRRPLELLVPDDLPSAYVDPDRLDQVLANLVSNALKFSPVGSPVTVEAWADDDVVEVAVQDRGRGMTPDALEQAFLKFHRGSGAEDTPGTGLGLYVSRAVVEAQGGQLVAESQPERGSRFTVVLPRHAPATEPA